MSNVARKLVFGIPDHFRHKPGCIATEDFLDLSNRAIVLTSMYSEVVLLIWFPVFAYFGVSVCTVFSFNESRQYTVR